MSEKVVLRYFNGRGKMESIRWLLAAAGVQFEEVFLTKREEYEKLLNGIVDVLELHCITRAFLNSQNYVKFHWPYKLMYLIKIKSTTGCQIYSNREYSGPVLMKIKVIYLITMHALLQALYNLSFVLQASQEKIKALPTISKFLQPGSARKPPPDEVYVKTVMAVLSHLFKQEAQ
uniref:Glutathione S-transferase 3-like n=1 Tax=Sinocyclocheilus grahami TaxID=75366 RepID=A0A672MEZ0_SINGR